MERFRKEIGDLTDLKKSIAEIGLIHPIVIDSTGKLIAGARRLQACTELGIEPIYRTVDFNDPVKAEIDENTVRKDFLPSEMYEIDVYYHNLLSKQGQKQLPSDSDRSHPRQIVAKIVGKNEDTISKIRTIFKSNNDDLKQKVDEGMPIDRAYQEIKREERKTEKIEMPLPTGKYNVIYIDPPWPVGSIEMDKWESPISDKYPVMTIDEIKALPILDLSADNCSLFLWTTHTFLPDAMEIIKHWNYKYHCLITWNKGSGWTQFGFHKMTEFLLFAYRGKMNIDQYGDAIPTLINERKTVHSKKPDSIRDLIKGKTPEGRLEMFARDNYEGWICWGNEKKLNG